MTLRTVAGGYGTNTTLAYSADGVTWTASANGNSIFTGACGAVAWNGTRWVAGGNGANTLAYSDNGIDWTKSTNGNSIITGFCLAVASGNTLTPDICLLKNTPVLVNSNKYVNIQNLQVGDVIQAPISNKQHKIKRVLHNTHYYYHLNPYNVPYKIPKHFFTSQYGVKTPTQDIYISGFHALLFSSNNSKQKVKMLDANQIQEFSQVSIEELKELGYVNDNDEVEYYNIELEEVDGMIVGGVPVETMGLKTLFY